MNPGKPIRVLLSHPDFHHELGGVQQYSRLLASALESSPWVRSLELLEYASGAGPSGKGRYLAKSARQALARPGLCIHTHVGLARVAPLYRFLGIPYWICAHGIECWNLRSRDEASALLGAERILAVSHYTRNRLLATLPALASRTVILPNHVESVPDLLTPQIEARQKLGLPREALLLLTVSRLRNDRYKGHREILAALHALGFPFGHVHYAIAGGGDDLDSLQQEVKDYQLSGRVHFLGPLSDRDRSMAYDACDAFVMPSTGEGFGIVFLEAMSHGKPVLAGSVDGSVDALHGHPCGVLVNPRNPSSVASGLADMIRRLEAGEPDWHPETLRRHIRDAFGTTRLQSRMDHLLEDFIRRQQTCAA